jgi:hypothetical protein
MVGTGTGAHNPLVDMVIEQVFETALLQDGIHPDPAAMANRLTALMEAATGTAVSDLDYTPEVTEPKISVVGLDEDEG